MGLWLYLLMGWMSAAVGRELAVDSVAAVTETNYCLEALKKLSDSTIYNSLTVDEIVSASVEDGIFHTNTLLKVELGSPFLKSGEMSESFDFIVMSHNEDGTKSFAIDEFPVRYTSPAVSEAVPEDVPLLLLLNYIHPNPPSILHRRAQVMDEAAIEEHWVAKVEARRVLKEESFRRLELQARSMAEAREARRQRGELSVEEEEAEATRSAIAQAEIDARGDGRPSSNKVPSTHH